MKNKVVLACTVCGSRNYSTPKKNGRKRVELKKYCKTCGVHTLHRQTK